MAAVSTGASLPPSLSPDRPGGVLLPGTKQGGPALARKRQREGQTAPWEVQGPLHTHRLDCKTQIFHFIAA